MPTVLDKIQNLRNIVAHDVFYEQRGEYDADGGVDQEQDMRTVHREPAYQSALDAVQQYFEQVGAQSGEYTDHDSQQHHDLAVAQPPGQAEELAVDMLGA